MNSSSESASLSAPIVFRFTYRCSEGTFVWWLPFETNSCCQPRSSISGLLWSITEERIDFAGLNSVIRVSLFHCIIEQRDSFPYFCISQIQPLSFLYSQNQSRGWLTCFWFKLIILTNQIRSDFLNVRSFWFSLSIAPCPPSRNHFGKIPFEIFLPCRSSSGPVIHILLPDMPIWCAHHMLFHLAVLLLKSLLLLATHAGPVCYSSPFGHGFGLFPNSVCIRGSSAISAAV